MAIQNQGFGGTITETDPVSRAQRVSLRAIDGTGVGRYRLGFQSGAVTGVAAATATAGHVFAFRWGSSASVALIHRVTARWITIAGFTTAQEVGLDLIRATAYSASHTGGTAVVLAAPNLKKRQSHAASVLTDARGPTTAALTAGTHTLDGQPMAFAGASELATGAAVQKTPFLLDFNCDISLGGPLELATNEGFIIRNVIAMGAAGTARLSIEVDWTEAGTAAGY